jgi:hypothetical protein
MANGEWRMANGWWEWILAAVPTVPWWCTLYYHSAVNFSKDKYNLIKHIHNSLLQFLVLVLVLQLLNLVSVLARSVGTAA